MDNTQKSKGILLIITSAFFYALMSVFVSKAGDLPFFEKVLFRNLVSTAVAAWMLLKKKIPLRVSRDCALPLILRALFGTISVFCNYYAIDHLLLANSNSLSKLSPFFAIMLSAVFLREKVSRQQLVCIGIALPAVCSCCCPASAPWASPRWWDSWAALPPVRYTCVCAQ